MTKEERSRLRNASTSKEFRSAVIELYGDSCINCGSKENVEFHHVVPIALGGTNTVRNVVPLCHVCHLAAHRGRHINHYVDMKNTGRKTLVESNPDVYKYIGWYVNGQIGKQKFSELSGYSFSSINKHLPGLQKYMSDNGIADFRNNVDIKGASSGVREGSIVGFIKYTDGRKEYTIYHDTGKNDVEYNPRFTPPKEEIEMIEANDVKRSKGESVGYHANSRPSPKEQMAFDMYASGQIGKMKLMSMMDNPSKPYFRKMLFEYKYANGIREIRNRVDEMSRMADFREGISVGYVDYLWRGKKAIFYSKPDESKLAV